MAHQPLSPSKLLKFYEKRLEKCDRDFDKLSSELDDLRISQSTLKELQWKCNERDRDISELRKTLAATQQALIDERRSHLDAVAENDRLRVNRHEDKKMIKYLMSTVENDSPNNENNKRRRGNNSMSSVDRENEELKIELQTLRLSVDTIRIQLEEQRLNNEEIIAGLKEELKKVTDQADVERTQLINDLEESQANYHSLQSKYKESLAELLDSRKQNSLNSQMVHQDRYILRAEILELKARLDAEIKRNDFMKRASLDTNPIPLHTSLQSTPSKYLTFASDQTNMHKTAMVELETNMQYLREDLDNTIKQLHEKESESNQTISRLESLLETMRADMRESRKIYGFNMDSLLTAAITIKSQLVSVKRKIARTPETYKLGKYKICNLFPTDEVVGMVDEMMLEIQRCKEKSIRTPSKKHRRVFTNLESHDDQTQDVPPRAISTPTKLEP
ncbi:hypothetical protein H4219_000524 [Mycoemilia scoparia]|uniref:Uncharacterized protein n=1 Tax=Mycoemilia scoparia TaxID=417184 RepID=A0A9W8DT37_9FUNG|nr:hypothetical protein H4219_000524 [Mycoemilia scoparia]